MAAEPPLDNIYIRDLVVRCIIGIAPHEREHRQDVVINVTLHADLRQAAASDNIDDTVNYKTIKDRIVEMVEGSHCYLIEHLAQRIADLCLADPASARSKSPGQARRPAIRPQCRRPDHPLPPGLTYR